MRAMADRFPYEIYADNGQYKNKDKRRWVRVLEKYGASNVKAVFTLLASNPGDTITFGSTPIPKDFAQHWVSWREGQTVEARQVALVRAARWSAFAAIAAAVAAIGVWTQVYVQAKSPSAPQVSMQLPAEQR